MLEPWRTGKFIRIEHAAPATRRFWIQIPEVEKFDFEPGQFVTLELPIHEKRNKRWRSYSIASAPDGTNIIELVIVLLEGGAGTTYLFNQVNPGTEVLLRGPQGKFTLPENLDKDLYLICTGTGIAPFRSMATYLKDHPREHKNIYIIFGCRTIEDILYYDELKQLGSNFPGFTYIPTLSRQQWEGRSGYVHAVYEDILKQRASELTEKTENGLAPAYFFLCGWKNMIDEARQRIVNLGYDKKDIHLELYG
ncbi:MAG TPA: FAD-dependent oxidoreductase [Chitinophagaceae bacterium]|nr:FAD-dependent oxidoreductase [Chitinophagaceae bacterium]